MVLYKCSCRVPLFRRTDSRLSLNDSWQYADMDNGTYYMLTRVKTHAAMYGQTAAQVLEKMDSLLYENIPGKILQQNLHLQQWLPGL